MICVWFILLAVSDGSSLIMSKGWGLSAKLKKHSRIWGKFGTAIQGYILNPCTKFALIILALGTGDWPFRILMVPQHFHSAPFGMFGGQRWDHHSCTILRVWISSCCKTIPARLCNLARIPICFLAAGASVIKWPSSIAQQSSTPVSTKDEAYVACNSHSICCLR